LAPFGKQRHIIILNISVQASRLLTAFITPAKMVFTLSATAPQFLPEQEKHERATLSPEEIAEIEGDINGTVKFKETEEMKQTGLLGLQKAMEAISDFEKRGYKEACEVAPELVERESNTVAFLRCERYNGEVRYILLYYVHGVFIHHPGMPQRACFPSRRAFDCHLGCCYSLGRVLEAAKSGIW
jgi:hypothetical protein